MTGGAGKPEISLDEAGAQMAAFLTASFPVSNRMRRPARCAARSRGATASAEAAITAIRRGGRRGNQIFMERLFRDFYSVGHKF